MEKLIAVAVTGTCIMSLILNLLLAGSRAYWRKQAQLLIQDVARLSKSNDRVISSSKAFGASYGDQSDAR